MKKGLLLACSIFCVLYGFVVAGSIFAADAVTTKAVVVAIDDEGKFLTFKTEAGEEVECKISSKRTTIDGGSAKDLKEGVNITITYTPDDDKNEPSKIVIQK